MIRNDTELQVTLERITRFQQEVAHLRRTETNPPCGLPTTISLAEDILRIIQVN
jgi:hypothetical protein